MGKDAPGTDRSSGVDEFEGDLDDVLDLSIQIMYGRMHKTPDDVPSHVIKDFIKEANRAADRRAAEKAAEREQQKGHQQSVLEVVRDSPLPGERKREIIEQEIARLETQMAALKGELDG